MIDNPLILFVAFPLAAYVVGSTPFGVIIARARGVDLRSKGSGNIGATNVGRVLGRKWGYLCFVGDVLKGLGPVLAAGVLLRTDGVAHPSIVSQAGWLAVAFGAIAGHVFSFWVRFRGGKGVATSLGVVVGFYPYFTWVGLTVLGVWIVVVLTSRYVSLASIAAAGVFPLVFVGASLIARWPLAELWPLLAFSAAMAGLVILHHRANIARLLAGTENKIRFYMLALSKPRES